MTNHISKALKRQNHLIGEIDAIYHEMAVKLGLSDSALKILYTICDQGTDCPLQTICSRSGLSKQTVNSALRKLESEGIVYLRPLNPRNKIVCLTEEGRLLATRTAGRILELENEIFASWPPENVEKYLELTEDYLNALRDKLGRL